MPLTEQERKTLVCHVLHNLWDRVREAKGDLRLAQDLKTIVDEDYSDVWEALERIEGLSWRLKQKYGCTR